MPEARSNFTDWQQVERESRLFVDGDFNWSEPPQRRRRPITEAAAPARRVAVLEYEPAAIDDYESQYGVEQHWDQPTEVHSHFDEMMEQWNANYGSGVRGAPGAPAERAFDLSDPGVPAPAQGARRTVVITGHGDDRYLPAPHRRRSAGLRFHERSGFSPDRAGLWAVLLGIALVIGAVAH